MVSRRQIYECPRGNGGTQADQNQQQEEASNLSSVCILRLDQADGQLLDLSALIAAEVLVGHLLAAGEGGRRA